MRGAMMPAADRARRLAAVLLLAAGLPLLGGCSPPPTSPDVAARLGDAEVPYARFEAYVRRSVGETDAPLESGVLTELFDQFLEEEMLVRLAADRGLTANAGVAPRRAIDALIQDEQKQEAANASDTDPEVATYYQQHRKEFTRPERVRLRQILIEDRRAADAAVRELAAGTGFDELARRISRDPSAASGGFQGELSRADLPPAFVDLVFGLQPGEVSPVVPANYGFHIFQVTERLPAEVAPLPQVRGEILERLRQQRADQLLGKLVTEARNRYNVVVYERNLPFHYEGTYSGV